MLKQHIKTIHKQARQTSKLEYVNVIDNIGVVYYSKKLASQRDKPGKDEDENWERVLHVWLYVSGKWKLIAGMSAPLNKKS